MQFDKFQQMMLKAKPGQRILYHSGLLIDDRLKDSQLDLIAKYVVILWDLDTARIYQKRNGESCDYFVMLTKRLRVRKDEQGSYQEAGRLMKL